MELLHRGDGIIIKFLNKLLRKYCWIYERIDGGDKGFVLAKSYESAIKKLKTIYDNVDEAMENEQMFVFDLSNIEIKNNVFITMPH